MRQTIERYVTELQQGILYATVIALLALGSVVVLGLEIWFGPAYPHLVPVAQRVDLVVAWIFLTDFFLGLIFNREVSLRMYWRQNWLNLVSSIPITSELTRVLRVLRMLRALRVIRVAANFYFAQQRARRNRHLLD